MEAIGVQVLVIDEVHNILAGSYREQRIVLNTLRFLSNRLQISLVCFFPFSPPLEKLCAVKSSSTTRWSAAIVPGLVRPILRGSS